MLGGQTPETHSLVKEEEHLPIEQAPLDARPSPLCPFPYVVAVAAEDAGTPESPPAERQPQTATRSSPPVNLVS